MNAPERIGLRDVQSLPDSRNLRIDAAGVKGIRYPVTLQAGAATWLSTVATFSMTVSLSAAKKGTHVSRFVELLEAQKEALSAALFKQMVFRMLGRLNASSGSIEMHFPYFVKKTAPVSGAKSHLDYEVCWQGSVSDEGAYSFWTHVMVPATSLCPCSKEISEYGAHNRRSRITIKAEVLDEMPIEALIGIAERSASSELYGLLKRPDEKYVTERAYDNPRFVEDLVREVALSLNQDARVGAYIVEAENFESIHNHSACARIAAW